MMNAFHAPAALPGWKQLGKLRPPACRLQYGGVGRRNDEQISTIKPNRLLKGLKLRWSGGVIQETHLRRSISPNFPNIKKDAGTRKSEMCFSVVPWHEKALRRTDIPKSVLRGRRVVSPREIRQEAGQKA